MWRWRFALMILFAAVLLAGAVGAASPARAQSDAELKALNDQVVALHKAAKYQEAIAVAGRYVEAAKKKHGEDHPDYATAISRLAQLLKATNRLAEAEPLMRRALAIDETSSGPEHPKVAIRLNNLAQLLKVTNRLAEAEPLYRRALAIDEKSLGPEHPNVATDLNNLALLLKATNRLAEAEPLYRRALAIDEKSFGPDHPEVATDLNNLAQLLQTTNRLAEAEPLMRRALAIDEKSLGPEHPDVATDLNNLALLLKATNRLAEAEPLYRRALAIDEKSFGPDHPEVATDLNNLAQLLQDTNRLAEAEPLMRRALAVFEKSFGPEHPTVARGLNNLARLRAELGDWAQATQMHRHAKPIMTTAHGKSDGLSKAMLTLNTWALRASARAEHRSAGSSASARAEGFELAQWALQTDAADALSQMSVRFAKGGGPLAQIVRERQDLISRRQSEDKRLLAAVGAADAKATQAIRAAISGLDARLDAIDARIAAEFKEFAALSSPKPLAIAEVQGLLRDNEAFVLFRGVPQFGRLPEESLVWAITKTDARWALIDPGTKALSDRVAALRCGLDHTLWQTAESAERCRKVLNASPGEETVKAGGKNERVQVLPFDLARAHALYKALLGPVEGMIKGKHLLVVPSGPLTSLPFHVLVTEAPSHRASPTSPQTPSGGNEGGVQQQTPAPVAAPHPSPLPAGGERESGRRALATLADYRKAAWLGARQPITVLPSVASLKALRQFAKASRASKAYLGVGNPLLDGPQDDPQWGAHYKKQAEAARAKQQCPRTLPQRIAQAAARPLAGFAKLFRGAQTDIEEVRRWTPLPETADELCEVGRRLGVPESEILLGQRATEAALKDLSDKGRLADYAILHSPRMVR